MSEAGLYESLSVPVSGILQAATTTITKAPETYDDDPNAGALGVPSLSVNEDRLERDGTTFTRADRDTYDEPTSIGPLGLPTESTLMTFTEETYDDDSSSGALSTP